MAVDLLDVGDLVIVNERFRKILYAPEKYEGIGIVIRKTEVHHGEIYEVYFNGWRAQRIPRHWLIKMNCPIEEEWKMWGNI